MRKQIVIVGGGAGGLELATQLGKKLGRKNKANITLIDKNHTHIWKPLLHEIATGSLDASIDELNYRAQAKTAGFRFRLGELAGIDRSNKEIALAALVDEENQEVLPQRRVPYDLLVLAVGSTSNDFATSGVADHCIFLDSRPQAERFHRRFLNAYLKANNQAHSNQQQCLNISIVGAGATGVELCAELRHAAEEFYRYGLQDLRPQQLQITLIEAGTQILPALPNRIATSAHKELEKIGVVVQLNTRVIQARSDGLETADGGFIKSDLCVWAAGIKGADILTQLDGLATNKNQQLLVHNNLQCTLDDSIFAIGDCAACPKPEGGFVPARAQAAHQQASLLRHSLHNRLLGLDIDDYQYRDYGSLVSLSKYSTVGNLMGNLGKGSLFIEGKMARLMYISLYRMHQMALYGPIKTALLIVSNRINRIIRPRLKLH